MALVLKDRVKETTTTTGTGTITLAGASTGYQSFSVIGNANTTYYCIAGQGTAEWEVGIGTYTASGTTLSRDTILASSNSGSVVTFSAGTKDVFVVYPAGKSVNLDASGNATALGTPASCTVTNFTGTASININGTVGATTPSTGAFTTLSASGLSVLNSAASLLRATINASNASAQQVDIAFTNSGGSTYIGQDAAGNSFIDARGALNNINFGYSGAVVTSIGTTGLTMASGMSIRGSNNLTLNATTGNSVIAQVNNTTVGAFSSTGLAVTGTLSASGVATFSAGSAAAPAITTSGDTNTGIFFPAADTIAFTEGGAEAMRIDSSGSVGIGTSSLTGYSLRVGKTVTGAVDSVGVLSNGLVQSDVTSSAAQLQAQIGLAASAFTLSNAFGLYVGQTALSGGAAITSQYGVYVANSLTGATNNYGFYSNIASSANRYNFYAAGTAENYFAGNVGIGAVAGSTTGQLRIAGNGSGATNFNGITLETSIQSGVTSSWRGLLVRPTTQATAFTLSNLYGVYVNPQTFGAGSTVTNQFGFHAESTLTGATNNYGFYSNIASGTGRWNFYANGTADNYFAGNVGIGTTSPTAKLHTVVTDASSVLTLERTGAGATSFTADFTGAVFNQSLSAGADYVWKEGGTEWMRLTNTGNVGIGTSSPSSKLEVYDATSAVARVTAGTEIFEIRNTGSEVRLAVVSADPMTFRTSNVEAMRIDSSGNVGIGTSSPSTYGKFAVQTQTSNAPTVAITGSGLNPQLNHYINDSTAVLRNLNQIQFVTGSSDISNYQGYMTFSTMGSAGGTISERMRIDSSGNVGIGTSSPTAKLDVSSDVIRLRTAKTPASASATGNAGDIAWDSSYIYVCVATNTWKRVAIATW